MEDLDHQLEWQARHRHSTRSSHRIGGAQGIQNRLLGRVDGGLEEAVQMLFCHTGCLDDGPLRPARQPGAGAEREEDLTAVVPGEGSRAGQTKSCSPRQPTQLIG